MAEGRRITWIGTVPNTISAVEFTAFDAQMTSVFGQTRIGTPQFQVAGTVKVASALYTSCLVQALIKVTPLATLTLYLNILWDGVPDMAALKAMVSATFGYVGERIIEDTVTL